MCVCVVVVVLKIIHFTIYSLNRFNSFTATGDNSRILQTVIVCNGSYEPSHLDLRCLTFSLSTLHMNFFSSDSLLRKEKQTTKVTSSEIWQRKS